MLSILIALSMVGCAHRTVTGNVAEISSSGVSTGEVELHEVLVKQVIMNFRSGSLITPVIILANKADENKFLPIWIGISEGVSINSVLNNRRSERPGTHDLFADVIDKFQMKIIKVVITDLRNDTYIASITVESNGEIKEIDSRPSDAIAIALRRIAPIFISEAVIRKGGWLQAKTDGKEENKVEKDSLL